ICCSGMSASADRSPPWEEGRASVRIRFSSSAPSGTPAERLTDDLLVEILSRVPVKSLCRFKCVSNHWLSLIHHPDHRKKLPQTLAGFFYTTDDFERIPISAYHLANFSGRSCPPIDTSFSFLRNHRRVDLLDCCAGLLLCSCYTGEGDRYIVCNPAREEWVMLPETSNAGTRGTVSLGFDLAVSSHFHVFVLLAFMDHDGNLGRGLTRVDIFSSETGRWVRKEKRWNENLYFLGPRHQSTVFLNGYMHFYAYSITSSHCVVVVDMEGETWTTFRIPGHLRHGFLQLSQGCLHYSSFQEDEDEVVRLVVYVLEDYDNKEWMLKHIIETSHISGWTPIDHRCIAIHPEYDLIFFTVGVATKIMCYDMNSRQVKLISNVEYDNPPYLLYVPLYAEIQSLHT
uniref:F-box domain-containing protein n=5 Tax=Triticinae TaxID=1648030 RepID=A0A453T0D4_AEGTS